MEQAILIGRSFGSWELIRLVGEGTFGAVYEARHRTIEGRTAAVKVLHPELSFNADHRRRFLNEANAASRAGHDNVVQILDCGETGEGLCFVVMELLHGESLKDRLRRGGPLDAAQTTALATQIAEALAALHGVGIIHRDLKPDNLFLVPRPDGGERLKVLDFGLAKIWDADLHTKTGMWMGTPPYMSPEQWQTLPDLDGRSDLYALGVILFECVTGRLPFTAKTPFEWLTAHLGEAPPDPRTFANVPDGLGSLILALLAKSPASRPADANEVLRRLRGEIPPAINPLPPTRRRGRAWAIGGAAILAFGGAILAFRPTAQVERPPLAAPVIPVPSVDASAPDPSPTVALPAPALPSPPPPKAPDRPARRKSAGPKKPAIRLVND